MSMQQDYDEALATLTEMFEEKEAVEQERDHACAALTEMYEELEVCRTAYGTASLRNQAQFLKIRELKGQLEVCQLSFAAHLADG